MTDASTCPARLTRGWTRISLLVLAFASCGLAQDAPKTLADARKGFKTKLTRRERSSEELETPPPELFELVRYATPIGKMRAYVGVAPSPGRKHPAILWITGGFPQGGASNAWERSSPSNDQSAKDYREAGLVMMYPTLRGSFGNPGSQETFFGEVDDVLAALDHLAQVDYVDPDRIYLGGHSTGGTLALLVAATTDRFRAVFAFGPVEDPTIYGEEYLTYDPESEGENRLRSPIHFLHAIRSPTYVIEGEGGNFGAFRALAKASENDKLSFLSVKGADHFDVLAPVNRAIAHKLASLESGEALSLRERDVQKAFDDMRAAIREAQDLRILASLRLRGVDLRKRQNVRYWLLSPEQAEPRGGR